MKEKKLTASQKKKADKIFKLLAELGDENVTFFMNSTPHLQLSFLRNHDTEMDMYEYQDLYNWNNEGDIYEPKVEDSSKFKLECYGF